jgi:hypothetical protein
MHDIDPTFSEFLEDEAWEDPSPVIEKPLAGDLPRGLGLIIHGNDPSAARAAQFLHHALAIHVATGAPILGFAPILARAGLILYSDLQKQQEGRIITERLFDELPQSIGQNTITSGVIKVRPLGRTSIDEEQERLLVQNLSHMGFVALEGVQAIADFDIEHEREFATAYLAKIAAESESTIAVVLQAQGEPSEWNEDKVYDTLWPIPELTHASWSAHIIPTEEFGVYRIHIIANGKTLVKIYIEDTGWTFREAS